MAVKNHLIWFRNDLRVRDHDAFSRIANESSIDDRLLCVWIQNEDIDRLRVGPFRQKFVRESLFDLNKSLQTLGQTLEVHSGDPAAVLKNLCEELSITDLWFQIEHTFEEVQIENAVETSLAASRVNIHRFEGLTLLRPNELPFSVEKLPKIFTEFRKKAEAAWPEIKVWPTPGRLPGMFDDRAETLIAGRVFGLDDQSQCGVGQKTSPFSGGETAGLQRLEKYFWIDDRLRDYKDTRNGLLGLDYSSKFSPWLSTGSLSERWIYEDVRRYEVERVKNDSTYWMIFELLWRDYFRFLAIQQKGRFFTGQQKTSYTVQHDEEAFHRWAQGRTGERFIDANMRELNETGYMSNRGRQNVASYLTRTLKCDWRKGAEYFERLLVDYDPASNWGNWSYFAGTGNDPRDRSFNIARQVEAYDPQGEYMNYWLNRS